MGGVQAAAREGVAVKSLPRTLTAEQAPPDEARERLLAAAVAQHRVWPETVDAWRALYVEDPDATPARILALPDLRRLAAARARRAAS